MRRSAACLLALAASACGPERVPPLGQVQQALSFPQGVDRPAARERAPRADQTSPAAAAMRSAMGKWTSTT